MTPIGPNVPLAWSRTGWVPRSQLPQPARRTLTQRRVASGRYAVTVKRFGSIRLVLTTTAPGPGPWSTGPGAAESGQPCTTVGDAAQGAAQASATATPAIHLSIAPPSRGPGDLPPPGPAAPVAGRAA